nr:putative capsid [Marmot picobirnavirus]
MAKGQLQQEDVSRSVKDKNDARGSQKSQSNQRSERRKRQTKKRTHRDSDPAARRMKSTDNDVSWYARTPELLRAAASLPAYSVVGDVLPIDNTVSVPGAMAIYWNPALAGFDNNAINQAKDSLYSYIVHANSRNQSYDASDLLMVCMASANVFTTLAHIVRAYGIAKQYSEMNRYQPKGLLTLMGFDPDDTIANLSNMWFDINQLIAQSSQLWMPNTMPFLTRQFWMNTNVYTDAESPKAQMYLYVPSMFYKYAPVEFEDGGALVPIRRGEVGAPGADANPQNFIRLDEINSSGTNVNLTMKWENWKELVQVQINALIGDQDRGIIFGDILKAFGAEKIYALSPISVDYRTPIVYNREVLMQIENAAIANPGLRPVGLKQNQQLGTIVQLWWQTSPKQSKQTGYSGKSVLNFHGTVAPSPEEIMVASRMHPGPLRMRSVTTLDYDTSAKKYTANPKQQLVPDSVGTEVVTGIKYVQFTETSAGVMTLTVHDLPQYPEGDTIPIDVVMGWASFDWSPWIYGTTRVVADPALPTSIKTPWALGDYDMYIFVDGIELNKMNTAAVYSEFGVPYL